MSKASTSDHVKHEAKGWGTIIVVGLAVIVLLPSLLGGALHAITPTADELTKPIPGNAKRTYGSTTPTTGAPRTLSSEELDARQQAKQIGDGLAKAKAAQSAAPVDPRGGLPAIGEAGGGSVLGQLIPGAEGAIKAIGPGLTKALNP